MQLVFLHTLLHTHFYWIRIPLNIRVYPSVRRLVCEACTHHFSSSRPKGDPVIRLLSIWNLSIVCALSDIYSFHLTLYCQHGDYYSRLLITSLLFMASVQVSGLLYLRVNLCVKLYEVADFMSTYLSICLSHDWHERVHLSCYRTADSAKAEELTAVSRARTNLSGFRFVGLGQNFTFGVSIKRFVRDCGAARRTKKPICFSREGLKCDWVDARFRFESARISSRILCPSVSEKKDGSFFRLFEHSFHGLSQISLTMQLATENVRFCSLNF